MKPIYSYRSKTILIFLIFTIIFLSTLAITAKWFFQKKLSRYPYITEVKQTQQSVDPSKQLGEIKQRLLSTSRLIGPIISPDQQFQATLKVDIHDPDDGYTLTLDLFRYGIDDQKEIIKTWSQKLENNSQTTKYIAYLYRQFEQPEYHRTIQHYKSPINWSPDSHQLVLFVPDKLILLDTQTLVQSIKEKDSFRNDEINSQPETTHPISDNTAIIAYDFSKENNFNISEFSLLFFSGDSREIYIGRNDKKQYLQISYFDNSVTSDLNINTIDPDNELIFPIPNQSGFYMKTWKIFEDISKKPQPMIARNTKTNTTSFATSDFKHLLASPNNRYFCIEEGSQAATILDIYSNKSKSLENYYCDRWLDNNRLVLTKKTSAYNNDKFQTNADFESVVYSTVNGRMLFYSNYSTIFDWWYF